MTRYLLECGGYGAPGQDVQIEAESLHEAIQEAERLSGARVNRGQSLDAGNRTTDADLDAFMAAHSSTDEP